MEFLVAMAILAIGNSGPNLPLQHVSLKGTVFCVIEVEWAKFTRFFFLRYRAVFQTVPHLTDLNRRLVHIDTCFKCENAIIFKDNAFPFQRKTRD